MCSSDVQIDCASSQMMCRVVQPIKVAKAGKLSESTIHASASAVSSSEQHIQSTDVATPALQLRLMRRTGRRANAQPNALMPSRLPARASPTPTQHSSSSPRRLFQRTSTNGLFNSITRILAAPPSLGLAAQRNRPTNEG
eukprot:6209936-Pleurochrysis_carterae.AAC.3